MLEITGEYIPIGDSNPVITRGQRIRSWIWPVRLTTETTGADWVHYFTFENQFTLRFGKLRRGPKRLTKTEDLHEHLHGNKN